MLRSVASSCILLSKGIEFHYVSLPCHEVFERRFSLIESRFEAHEGAALLACDLIFASRLALRCGFGPASALPAASSSVGSFEEPLITCVSKLFGIAFGAQAPPRLGDLDVFSRFVMPRLILWIFAR